MQSMGQRCPNWSKEQLREDLARAIIKRTTHSLAERELKYCAKYEIKAVASTDSEYPQLMSETDDYPHVIYVRGSVESLARRMVSVVGTRAATQYGLRMCEVLIGRLAELCPEAVIASGLAFGIDAATHRAALGAGLTTIAVLPTILPDITPAQNQSLADEIISRGGAVISELNSQTKQNGKYYIPRNRLIAAISEGTVVVESPLESGALSTAGFANEYNRTLMAVPGRAGDKCSEGANMLIKRRLAAMVSSADDIVYEIGWDKEKTAKPLKKVVMPPLSGTEQNVISCFVQGEAIGLDDLALASNMSVGELTALLLGLELSGIVRSLPGKMYELTI